MIEWMGCKDVSIPFVPCIISLFSFLTAFESSIINNLSIQKDLLAGIKACLDCRCVSWKIPSISHSILLHLDYWQNNIDGYLSPFKPFFFTLFHHYNPLSISSNHHSRVLKRREMDKCNVSHYPTLFPSYLSHFAVPWHPVNNLHFYLFISFFITRLHLGSGAGCGWLGFGWFGWERFGLVLLAG